MLDSKEIRNSRSRIARSKNIIIIPYYSNEEVTRFSRLARIVSDLGGLEGRFEFLLSARYDFSESQELHALYSRIAPTRSFRCSREGRGIGKPDAGAKIEGPSSMFWDTMGFIEKNYPKDGGFALWMESDMVPVKKDWLKAISAEWVPHCLMMGFFVDRSAKLLKCASHINGGACYAKDFISKVSPANFDLRMSWDHQILPFLLKSGMRYKFINGLIDFRRNTPVLDWKPDHRVAIMHGIKDYSAHEYTENKYNIKQSGFKRTRTGTKEGKASR